MILGIALLVVVCLIWSVASLVVADAEDAGVDPFFITFVCNSLFVLYLPISKTKTDAPIAKILSPLWMLANGTYNVSLGMTSITSSTILSNTSSLWALFFAVRWKIEGRGQLPLRIAGSFLCIAGSALAAVSDAKAEKESFLGDLFALLSAAMYGAYGAGLRLTKDSEERPVRFFGLIGLWNFLYFLGPLILYLGIATHGFHPKELAKKTGFAKNNQFGLIVGKGLFDNALSDFLWAQAVVYTTPTVATVGLSLTIPLAFLTDAFITNDLRTSPKALGLQISGASLVIAGFVLTVVSSIEQQKEQQPPERICQEEESASIVTSSSPGTKMLLVNPMLPSPSSRERLLPDGTTSPEEEEDDERPPPPPQQELGDDDSTTNPLLG